MEACLLRRKDGIERCIQSCLLPVVIPANAFSGVQSRRSTDLIRFLLTATRRIVLTL